MQKGSCKYFSNCEFYKKHTAEISRIDKNTIFHQYISIYCYGALQRNCYRYLQKEETGVSLPEDITPTGVKYTL